MAEDESRIKLNKVDIGEHIAALIIDLVEAGRVVPYGVDVPDNEYDEICWSQYGLIDTNEIAVLVRNGNKVFGAKAQSGLIVPPMADRVWGMDVLDQEIAFELGEKLWARFSEELVQAK
jgi:hypothetical protein